MREHKIQVHKKDGSKEEKSYILIQFFAVYFAATVFWCAILSVFPFEIEPAFVYMSQLLPVAVWVAMVGNKKRSMLLSVMAFVMSVTLIAVFRKEIYQGGIYMANQYITLRNKFYASSQPLIEGGESGKALMLSIVAIQILIAAVFAAVLVERKMAAVAVILFVIPLALAATVGHMPSIVAVWSMLGAGIFYFIVYREQKTAGAMKGSLAAIGAFAGMVIIATIMQPAILEVKEKYKKEYVEINKALIKSQNVDVVDSILSSLGGNANYAVGGIGKGDLRNLAQNRPRGSRDMEIVLSQKPLEPIYLKAFVGAEYTGTMWERPPKKEFMKMLDKTGISDGQRTVMEEPYRQVRESVYPPEMLHMEMSLKAAQREFAYAPYYAEIDQGDSIYADAYIEGKGKKNRAYDFYPRGRSEALEVEELPRNSEVWMHYVTYVEKQYREYPTRLESLEAYCDDFDTISQDGLENAINKKFQQQLSYTLEPGSYPREEDFVEYFLTESKEGFCVHFATAATILYRMKGYPSRYVEGYVVPQGAFTEQEDGTYKAIVTDKMAHAWCETFNQELGWKVREHTVGYSDENTEVMDAIPEENQTNAPQNQDPENESAEPEEPEEPKEQQTKESAEIAEKTEAKKKEGNTPLFLKDLLQGFLTVIVVVVVSLSLCVIQRKIRVQKRKSGFHTKSVNKSVVNIYRAIYEVAVFAGIEDRLDNREDDRETLEKMKQTFPQLTSEEWEWLYNCATQASFSKAKTEKEDLKSMLKFYRSFRTSILQELKGRRKYTFLYWYAL